MSDTPRMDSALRKAQEDYTESYLLTEGLKLERELNAANKRLEELSDWKRWCEERQQKLDEMAKAFSQQQDRIKRLEELGHELRECASWVGHSCCQYVDQIRRAKAAIEAWDKEAKL